MTATAPKPTALEPWEQVAQIIDVAIANAGPSFHSAILAADVMDDIRRHHPKLWNAWTASLALDQLKRVISGNRQAQRRSTSALARRGFALTEEVDSSHTLRQIGDCVRSDLDYIARSYSKRARTNNLRAQRFKALRDRMPNDTALVRDVIPEQDVEAVYA